MNAWPNPLGYELDPSKGPAAVVLLLRGPLVLALTRKREIANLHLPGGKREDKDCGIGKRGLVHTAIRELHEEARVEVDLVAQVHPLIDFVTRTGRPVRAFEVVPLEGESWPETFEPTDAGQPGWINPAALLAPWCTFREEAETILTAHIRMMEHRAP